MVKRILITAGPTWVPIDRVRVISNIATGKTGILLASRAAKLGAKVTLLLGPVSPCYLDRKIKVIHFKFFNELRVKLIKELRLKKYDFVIHCAAVSDFRPKRRFTGKIVSEKALTLRLVTLPKIIKYIRALASEAKIVIFKLEVGISDSRLINRARQSLLENHCDFAVANKSIPGYRAFILDKDKVYFRADSKQELARKLIAFLLSTTKN